MVIRRRFADDSPTICQWFAHDLPLVCCRCTSWSCHAFISLNLMFITDGVDVNVVDTHAHVHDDGDAQERLSVGAD